MNKNKLIRFNHVPYLGKQEKIITRNFAATNSLAEMHELKALFSNYLKNTPIEAGSHG